MWWAAAVSNFEQASHFIRKLYINFLKFYPPNKYNYTNLVNKF